MLIDAIFNAIPHLAKDVIWMVLISLLLLSGLLYQFVGLLLSSGTWSSFLQMKVAAS